MNILQVKQYYLLIEKRVIERAKSTYSPLGKALEKKSKTIEDQGDKQIKASEGNEKKQIVKNN